MELKNKNIGFVLTGSYCTFRRTIDEMKKIVQLGANVFPVMSYNSYNLDTKFGKEAYAYYQDSANDPSKAVEVQVKITSSRIHPSLESGS